MAGRQPYCLTQQSYFVSTEVWQQDCQPQQPVCCFNRNVIILLSPSTSLFSLNRSVTILLPPPTSLFSLNRSVTILLPPSTSLFSLNRGVTILLSPSTTRIQFQYRKSLCFLFTSNVLILYLSNSVKKSNIIAILSLINPRANRFQECHVLRPLNTSIQI